MAQLGHTDPKFTLRVYSPLIRRNTAERAQLKALVEGDDWAQIGENGRIERPRRSRATPTETQKGPC